jgi:hypothetical protein
MMSRISLISIVAMLGLLLAACSSDDAASDASISSDDAAHWSEEASEPAKDADAAPVSDGSHESIGAGQVVASFDRKVIRNAELEVVATDVASATRQDRDVVTDHGGYLASSSTRATGERERNDLSFEVPSESFEDVLSQLRDGTYVVRVEHESTSSQDVTEEYVDLSSRLTNLEATEGRFVDLLGEAGTIAEILNVEQEITRVRGDIEQIKGRLNYLEQRTDFSRIYLTIWPEEDAQIVASSGFAPLETAREAWSASMEFMGTAGNAAVSVVVFFWWMWPLFGLALLAVTRYRRRTRIEQQAA